MINSRKNRSACLAFIKDEQGFNFITTLTILAVISFTLPFLGFALQLVKQTTSYHELSVNEFFRFIRDDIVQSHSYYIRNNNELVLIQENERKVSISQYDSLVRRQVDGKGHEIYLRDVEKLEIHPLSFGIRLVITVKEGESFEKEFAFYNET